MTWARRRAIKIENAACQQVTAQQSVDLFTKELAQAVRVSGPAIDWNPMLAATERDAAAQCKRGGRAGIEDQAGTSDGRNCDPALRRHFEFFDHCHSLIWLWSVRMALTIAAVKLTLAVNAKPWAGYPQ
jgi:hypothetical protein